MNNVKSTTGLGVALAVLVFLILLFVSVVTIFFVPCRSIIPPFRVVGEACENDSDVKQMGEAAELEQTDLPIAPKTYRTEEECEEVTGQNCSYVACDYIPDGKTFEEVCGVGFKKGWSSMNVVPDIAYWETYEGGGFSISYPPDWRTDDSGEIFQIFNYDADDYIGGEAFKEGDVKIEIYRYPLSSLEDELLIVKEARPEEKVAIGDKVFVQHVTASGAPAYYLTTEEAVFSIAVYGDIDSQAEALTYIVATFNAL